jgi:hypothetical protein
LLWSWALVEVARRVERKWVRWNNSAVAKNLQHVFGNIEKCSVIADFRSERTSSELRPGYYKESRRVPRPSG